VELLTERLVLREHDVDDWRAVVRYQSDPRYVRFYPWSTRDEAAVRQFVGESIAWQADEPRRFFRFAMTLPPDKSRLIGSCAVRVNDPGQREGNIGYELDPEYWGMDTPLRQPGRHSPSDSSDCASTGSGLSVLLITVPPSASWRDSLCAVKPTCESTPTSRIVGGTASLTRFSITNGAHREVRVTHMPGS
jgi:hypothetical protein